MTTRVGQLLAAAAVAATVLATAVSPVAAAAEGTRWTYYGKTGPAFWGSLDKDWRTCDTGRKQTPIDLIPTKSVQRRNLASVSAQFTGSFLPVGVQNGFKYDCVSDLCGRASWAGVNYKFVQFHMHVSSEHTLNGQVLPAEIHLVHASDDGKLLVVGVMLTVGAPNPLLRKMLAAVEKTVTGSDPKKFSRVPISRAEWATLVPAGRGFCNYSGSLTTPPCSEGVTWILSRRVVTASISQLARLARALLDSDSVVLTERPVQPLNGRRVVCYGE